MFQVKVLYLADIKTAAGSGVLQHPNTFHTSVANSVTYLSLPSMISTITLQILT